MLTITGGRLCILANDICLVEVGEEALENPCEHAAAGNLLPEKPSMLNYKGRLIQWR